MTGPLTGPATSSSGSQAFLEALDRLLDALPVGSLAFTGQVGTRFWPDPDPRELKALAAIAEGRCLIGKGPARQAVVRAVGVRQRVHRLRRTPAEAYHDPALLEARSAEWLRIAKVTREILEVLPVSAPSEPGFSVYQAARELLFDPVQIEGESELEAGLARLADAAQGGAAAEPVLANPPLAEALPLLERLAQKTLGPEDPLYLQVWVACAGTRQDLTSPSRPVLERHRRLLQRISADLETLVTSSLQSHSRNPEQGRHLAPWRRHLQDTLGRLHEALTRPASEAAGPVSPPADEGDGQLVERLRRVRSEYEPVSLEAVPAARSAGAWWKKILGR